MSLSCPIGPEFDALVLDLKSTAAARAAVALNNDVIPDAVTAQSLLDATLLVNEDDKIRKSNDAFTLKKMQEEHEEKEEQAKHFFVKSLLKCTCTIIFLWNLKHFINVSCIMHPLSHVFMRQMLHK